jgi:ABC-type transport system substrate-binding protein
LGAVLLFHDSAVERGLRKGTDWAKLGEILRLKLQEVQLSQLRALAEHQNWGAASELASRLADAYPTQKKVQDDIVRILAKSAHQSLQKRDYRQTYSRLLFLKSLFPNSTELDSIRDGLKAAAQHVLNEAKVLQKQKKIADATARLDNAKEIYPELPGLRDFDLLLNKQNPVLYVGVRDLPEYLSPATAYLDSEKQAVELLFESLVKPIYSPKVGQRYQPCLASDLPKMVPLGRQFTLTPGAYWSDEHPVMATDVRRTTELLGGHPPEWAELMEGAHIPEDSSHVTLTLRQGYLDPLSLMSFKVLPSHRNLTRADDASFAKMPVGSGPYQFQTRDASQVVFVANPYYEMRSGKAGLPRIREIHFIRSENPVNEFREERLQLLLDWPSSRFKELENARDDVKLMTLPNRRIYFLAVNHQNPLLGKNQALRRAIAHAINREEILKDCFRAGLTPSPHRPLNGPYLLGSWAYNPTLKADPYDRDLAKSQATKAKEGRTSLGRLSLKYPSGDSAVAKACQQIQEQVKQVNAGVELELTPVEPRLLRRDVEWHDYDLAYYAWDYPDDTYWLWPLFDPAGIKEGGHNFLGYQNDEVLEGLMRSAMGHRDFSEVKRITHSIHEDFYAKMPFIPLWQLDTHLAIHKSLSMVDGRDRPIDIDPLLIFANVEAWTLNKR